MKKLSLTRYFTKWLDDNAHRFKNPPEIIRRKNGALYLKYPNIISAIEPCFRSGAITVYVNYPDTESCFDAVIDIDFDLGKTKAGEYYCTLCDYSGKRKLYGSIEDILVDHQFEKFLEWSNKNIIENSFVGLFSVHDGGLMWAKLIPKNKLMRYFNKNYEGMVALFSLKEWTR